MDHLDGLEVVCVVGGLRRVCVQVGCGVRAGVAMRSKGRVATRVDVVPDISQHILPCSPARSMARLRDWHNAPPSITRTPLPAALYLGVVVGVWVGDAEAEAEEVEAQKGPLAD